MKKINLESKQISRLTLLITAASVLVLAILMIFLPADLKASFAVGFMTLSVAIILYSNSELKKGKEHFVTMRVSANFLLLSSVIALCIVSSLK